MFRSMLCMLLLVALSAISVRAEHVLVEAESFKEPGGWSLDTQFIQTMGSPYLLAHGMGEPVKDASTTVKFPKAGSYNVFVRTKDWVAIWKAPGAPGKFQLLVNGNALSETFGTKGEEWFWHPGGKVEITGTEATLALKDLTGFEGRCDAIYFTTDTDTPPNDLAAMAPWRKKTLGLPENPIDAGTYDLVVVGGGYAGLGSAISAARMGCKVALIQDRPVLGGNGSSEVRVWAMGGVKTGVYPTLGEIVDEFTDRAKSSPGTYEEFGDAKKEALVRAEKNISLFLNHHALAVETANNRITSVTALSTQTGELKKFTARFFADCTGHAYIGYLAKADHTIMETGHLGMSNMWRWKDSGAPYTFPEVPWALPLNMADFPYPRRFHAEWFWESGFNKHPIKELENTRDWNFRAIYGAFNAMKNGDGKAQHANAKLEWVAFIGGTRESRQLLGDVILNREDIVEKKPFPDGCVPTTWDIDLHYPKEQYMKKFPDDPFISKAVFDSRVDRKHGYPVPYRCLYSRNIENMFMAGRNVSVTHEALGTVRVMKTGGMMGEVVGKAVSICVKHKCNPRDVYTSYLDELKSLMKLPGKARRESVSDEPVAPAGSAVTESKVKPGEPKSIDPKLPDGAMIDESEATLNGDWKDGRGLAGFIGDEYKYSSAGAAATARFDFKVASTGTYELKLSHQPHENRSTKTAVTITAADGEKKLTVNQRSDTQGAFISLGKYKFEAGKVGTVLLSGAGADGLIHVDALQVLPAQ